jgi:EAL domain-containing protein (putative c-di-GMP-specific phosphodiesterase class I)
VVARRVMSHLRKAGVPPHLVVLEITETASIHDLDAASRQVASLIDAGLGLWLDDFGTGHSTLEWLCRLPCHGIKLPGAFVDHLPDDARARTIVTHAIALAHDLGLRVIAECVEQEAQRELLEAQGCDALQGFLFHPALPAAALPRALAGRLGTAEEGPRP